MSKRKFTCQFHGDSTRYCCGNCDEITPPEIKAKLDAKRDRYLQRDKHKCEYFDEDGYCVDCVKMFAPYEKRLKEMMGIE